jgi:hypothetical protein
MAAFNKVDQLFLLKWTNFEICFCQNLSRTMTISPKRKQGRPQKAQKALLKN